VPSKVVDFVVAFWRAVGSSTDATTGVVKVQLEGGEMATVPGGKLEAERDESEVYGQLGFIARPRDPSKLDGVTVGAEPLVLRRHDSVMPIAWRDLRLSRLFSAKAGTVAMVGYGGGFDSHDFDAGSGANIRTTYVPYDFSAAGVAQKAMLIALDPVTETISIVHGRGQSISMGSDGAIMMVSGNGGSFFQMTNSQITLQTAQLVLNGGAVVVGNPVGAILPMVGGTLSPPCPRLFFNPAG
jgi:hypothetical protein